MEYRFLRPYALVFPGYPSAENDTFLLLQGKQRENVRAIRADPCIVFWNGQQIHQEPSH